MASTSQGADIKHERADHQVASRTGRVAMTEIPAMAELDEQEAKA
jgi:hypothetical protein